MLGPASTGGQDTSATHNRVQGYDYGLLRRWAVGGVRRFVVGVRQGFQRGLARQPAPEAKAGGEKGAGEVVDQLLVNACFKVDPLLADDPAGGGDVGVVDLEVDLGHL